MQEQQPRSLSEGDAQLLKAWLLEETGLQNELAGMLASMERHIVKHDVHALESHLVSSSEMLGRMEALEKKRTKILGHLVRQANLRGENRVLERLVDLSPVSCRDDLHNHRRVLEEAGAQVRTKSNRNGLLARSAIDINDEIVRGMFDVGSNTATYDRQGGKKRHSEMILNRSI